MTTPLTQALDRLMSRQDERTAWLLRAGPVARRLNAEAANDPTPRSHLADELDGETAA
jgi:hypothetical protein